MYIVLFGKVTFHPLNKVSASALQEIARYVDEVVSIVNLAITKDGSNVSDAPSLK